MRACLNFGYSFCRSSQKRKRGCFKIEIDCRETVSFCFETTSLRIPAAGAARFQ